MSSDQESTLTCKQKLMFKLSFLFLLCLSSIGNIYCYSIPGAIQSIIRKDLNINSASFMGLYTWYSVPNIILCLVGSFVVDRYIGLAKGGIICILFLLAGQIILATGGYVHNIWVMYIGRLIFGIGGETFYSVTNSYAALWFKGGELNVAFALQLSFACFFGTVCIKSMNKIYYFIGGIVPESHQLGVALYFAAITCLISLVVWGVMNAITNSAKKHKLIIEEPKESHPISLKDVFHFGTPFWLLTLICCTYYIATLTFVGIALSYFELKYKFDLNYATTANGMIFLAAAISSPVIGFINYKTGRNLIWIISSIILAILPTLMFAFSFISPLVLMIVLGISLSFLVSSLWPLVAYIVPLSHLTTAYGAMQSIQNLGLTVAPFGVGALVDNYGYFSMELFNVGCLYLAFIAAVGLFFFEKQTPILNANSQDIRNYLAKQ